MAKRKPRGQYVKLSVETFIRTSAGADQLVQGAAGLFCTAILYNDAQHGELLQVNGVHLWPNGGNSTSLMGLQQGLMAGASNPTTWSGQLVGAPRGPGTVYQVKPNVALAAPFALSGNTFLHWEWLPDWPICILPPGWSLNVQSGNSGQSIAIGFWWTVLKGE